MVISIITAYIGQLAFQYSLCRVVLMVVLRRQQGRIAISLSVLALSSRFDGLCEVWPISADFCLSVLALSSRFDGPSGLKPDSSKP